MIKACALIVSQCLIGTLAFAATPTLQLHIVNQPHSSCSGQIEPLTVQIEDQNGNLVTSENTPVTLVAMGSKVTLNGITTVNAINGVAQFLSLNIDGDFAGVKLIAESQSITSAYSNSFNVGEPACLARFNGLRSAITVSSTKVRLNWNASPDKTIKGYRVYEVSKPFSPVLMTEIDAKQTSLTIANLSAGQTYFFRIRSVDAKNVEDKNLTDLGVVLGNTTDFAE